jgi:hypothetical protein
MTTTTTRALRVVVTDDEGTVLDAWETEVEASPTEPPPVVARRAVTDLALGIRMWVD